MMDNRLKILGCNIKAERVRKNLSQMELAEMIDRSKDTISKIESGKQSPSAMIVYDIVKALKISFDDLYKFLEE